MFKRNEFTIEADLTSLARVLYTFQKVAHREGISAYISVNPILERDPATFMLRPTINKFRITVPRSLYRKVAERVEEIDVIQSIMEGGYEIV